MTAGLYIHIPFCVSKCDYCDFLSFPPEQLSMLSPQCRPETGSVYREYAHALINEMRLARETVLRGVTVDTVYVGGGTPTAMPAPFLFDILVEANRFLLTRDAEITVEANPGTLTEEKLTALAEGGVNRLSLGLQAWHDDLLQTIGRRHTRSDFLSSYEAARGAGIANINVDLIFALPGQSLDNWRETLTAVAALRPEHISAYSLTPADGTRLWSKIENKEIILPSEDDDRDMYSLCNVFLAAQGYVHYELSNYARPGFESRHNLRYWNRSPYFGFGLGAHSFDGLARWHQLNDGPRYINAWCREAPTVEKVEAMREEYTELTQVDAMSETMFLGLRRTNGVSEADFGRTFGVPLLYVYGEQVAKLTGEGLLVRENGYVRLTTRGMDLANQAFMAFI